MSTTFFNTVDEIRSIAGSSAPLASRWERMRPLLDDLDVRRVFFADIATHELLPILWHGGYFEKPAAAEQTVGGGTRHVAWPPSQYLRALPRGTLIPWPAFFAGSTRITLP